MNTEETKETNVAEPAISFEKFVTTIPQLANALCSDSILYFADEKHVSIAIRKELILTNIQLLRERFNVLERALS